MRARVFVRDPDFRYAGELDADAADDVWRQLQLDLPVLGRPLRSGDIVYIEDRYYELNGDGGRAPLMPGPMTEQLYQLVVAARGRPPEF